MICTAFQRVNSDLLLLFILQFYTHFRLDTHVFVEHSGRLEQRFAFISIPLLQIYKQFLFPSFVLIT